MKRRGHARLLLIALTAALAHAGAHAQTTQEERARAESASYAATPGRPLVARKIDEFGRVGGCDHSARLDNFAIELQNAPGSVGHVIAYGVGGESSGAAGYRPRS